MSKELEKIESIFFEEMSTRKPLINYTVKYFTELSPLLEAVKSSNEIDDAYEMAMTQLNRNSQHIAALYVAGIVHFERGDFDDTHFERLLSIFKNIKKWAIVEFLAQQVLSYKETVFALKYLASYYQVNNSEEKAVDIWERLVKVDSENYEYPEKIAHAKEREEDIESALYYYEISAIRNIAKHRENTAESNLKKILELRADSLDFFLKIEESLYQMYESGDKMIDTWKQLFFYYFDDNIKNYEKALVVIKRIASYEEEIKSVNSKKAKFFRHRLSDTYKALYPEHSAFEEFARLSHLTNPYKDAAWCIDQFEKHIQFDVKKYVYHRNFGAGKVKSISTDELIIDFKDSPAHKMSFELALKSLTVLDEEDIRVYKAYRLRSIKKIAEEDPNKLIAMALKSAIGDRLASKDLKHMLVPEIVAENQYNKWLDTAKKEVRANNDIKFVKNTFVFKQGALSYDEETLDNFNRERDFSKKFQIYLNYANYAKNINCAQSKEMANYFIDETKSEDVNYKTIKSIYILNLMEDEYGLLTDLKLSIDSVIGKVEDFCAVYEELPIAKLREKWVASIIRNFNDKWPNIISDFLYTPQVKNHHIITDRLINMGKADILEKTIGDIIIRYNEYTESFLYFASKLLEGGFDTEIKESGCESITYSEDLLIIGLLNLIPHLNRLMEKKENLAQNRKMLKNVYELLFEEDYLLKFINKEEKEAVSRVFKEFKKLIGIENHYKTKIITAVAKRFPDLS